jgi:hypothetical protein
MNVYKENIFQKKLTIVLVLITGLFLYLFLNDLNIIIDWLFIVMFLVFGFITLNFHTLNITLTSKSITTGYGLIKKKVFLKNIKKITIDTTPTWKYGGWGIRIRIFKGKWRIVFNVIGTKRIIIFQVKGADLVISTKNPKKLIKIIKEKITVIKK